MTLAAWRDRAVLACCAAGLLALGLRGDRVVPVLGLVACVLAPWARSWAQHVVWTLVTLPVLGCTVAWAAAAGTADQGVTLALAYMMVRRTWGREGPADDRLALVIATLMMVGASTRSTSAAFLPIALAWAVAGTLALALIAVETVGTPRQAHVEASSRAGLQLGGAVVLVAALVFPVLPRWNPGARPTTGAGHRTGVAEGLATDSLDGLLDDPTPVLRVRTERGVTPTRVRVTAFDRYEDGRWSRTRAERVEPVWQRASAPDAWTVEILEPEGELLPVPGGLSRLEGVGTVRQDLGGSWLVDEVPSMFRAEGFSLVEGAIYEVGAPIAPEAARDPGVGSIAAVARGIAGDIPHVPARVEALQAWLGEHAIYTREDTATSVEDFLVTSPRGHCELFAASLTLMARSLGVPARVVVGYAGGELADDGVLFRRSHAHAWAEVWISGRGWLTVDPTPTAEAVATEGPSLDDPPVGGAEEGPGLREPSLAERLEATVRAANEAVDAGWQGFLAWGASEQQAVVAWVLARLRAVAPLVALVLLGWGAFALWSRLEARPRRVGDAVVGGPVAQVHARARRALAGTFPLSPSLPPVGAARRVRLEAPEVGGPLEELAWLVYEERYGAGVGEDGLGRAQALGAAIEAALAARAEG